MFLALPVLGSPIKPPPEQSQPNQADHIQSLPIDEQTYYIRRNQSKQRQHRQCS